MMLKSLRSYLPFISNEIKNGMQYRLPFFITILSRAFTVLVTYYLWRAIYNSSPDTVIGGFDFQQITSYIIISFLTSIIVSLTSGIDNMIAFEITEGRIAMNLIKPINYRMYCFSIMLGKMLFNAMTTVIPFMLILTLTGLLEAASITEMFLYALSCLLGFTIINLFGFCFSMFAFYTTYYFGISMAKTVIVGFLSGATIPLTFFPSAIEKVLSILPFSSMNYTPVMIYLGKLTGYEALVAIGLQIFWIIFFFGLGSFLWMQAVKRLTILGG